MTGSLIIVEGKTDKARLEKVLAEPTQIYCTHGSFSFEKGEKLQSIIEEAEEVYIFTDEDYDGKKLRQQLKEEIPWAHHLHTRKVFAEVARTPLEELAMILDEAGFETIKYQ
ncbi:toprim domain-containing protein [Brevibacillus daliensis]|uniref:toprim domain-containing protein n=1 Tax=Brevibacillus daliensis TaxID=2892995 RepID=UPI001E402E14|nr:toprim domain-containing protein [Brevibacillus daliensis]